LALPRGGVVVAAQVAAALDAPVDLILVRKKGVGLELTGVAHYWVRELHFYAPGGAAVRDTGDRMSEPFRSDRSCGDPRVDQRANSAPARVILWLNRTDQLKPRFPRLLAFW
jgi:hypothetical protein